MTSVSHVFWFGKYNGQKVTDIIETDPKYVSWAIDNVKYFSINDEENDLLRKALYKYSEKLEKYIQDKECLRLMRKYKMHATEALSWIEYDEPEHF